MKYMTKMTGQGTADRQSKQVIHEDVDIREGQYGYFKKVDRAWIHIACGRAVYVEEVIKNIDTLKVTLVLYFIDNNSEKITIYFPREDLTENRIINLTAYGIRVTKQCVSTFIKSIENQEVNAPNRYAYDTLGFAVVRDKKIYKGANAIGMEAYYTGKLRIHPKGSFKKWMTMVENEVLGQTPLEFILASAISGLLVDFLKEKLSLENVIIHLVGQSSTGKTTATLLAVSCGSAPDMLGDNFVFSFADTLNSMMKMIPNSYPTVIDEGSLIDKEMTQAMYSLSSGIEKRRMNKDYKVEESARFRTVVFCTSEKSILSHCNENSGLLVRNMEFSNVTFTKNATSADMIKQTIRENYGFVLPKVAQWLLETGEETVADMVIKEMECLIEQSKNCGEYNNLTERAAKQSALITASVDILKTVFDLKLDKEGIVDFIHEHSLVKDPELVSMGRRAMMFLLQYITKESKKFIQDDEDFEGYECKGRLARMDRTILKSGEISFIKLYIAKNEFVDILQKGNFSEEKIILKEWRDELGYLQSEKTRFVSNIKVLEGLPIKGYVIFLPEKKQKSLFKEKQMSDKNKERKIHRPIRKYTGNMAHLKKSDEIINV